MTTTLHAPHYAAARPLDAQVRPTLLERLSNGSMNFSDRSTENLSITLSTDEQVKRMSMGIEKIKGALEEVRKQIADYDAHFNGSETASVFLNGGFQEARSAIDDLTTAAGHLKDKGAEVPFEVFLAALATASLALERINMLAATFDEQYKVSSTLSSATEESQQQCAAALEEVAHLTAFVASSANVQAISVARRGAKLIFLAAAALDERFKIEDNAISAKSAAEEKARNFDERHNVKENVTSLAQTGLETAQGLDQQVAEGKVTPAVLSAFEKGLAMATDGLAFAKDEYELAKRQRAEEATPPEVESETKR